MQDYTIITITLSDSLQLDGILLTSAHDDESIGIQYCQKMWNKKLSYRRDNARCGSDHSNSLKAIRCCANRHGI